MIEMGGDVKVGDLVKFTGVGRIVVGVVTGFDDNEVDPVVLDFKTKVQRPVWAWMVEVINESR